MPSILIATLVSLCTSGMSCKAKVKMKQGGTWPKQLRGPSLKGRYFLKVLPSAPVNRISYGQALAGKSSASCVTCVDLALCR